MQILLAEDNETNRKVATKLAESLGHSVDVVENGFDAVEKARDGNYDVILMDVQMPIVDGREATRRIRNEFRDAGGGPRIIAVTANVLLSERESCLASGMDDYVAKPLRLEELKRALDAAQLAARETIQNAPPSGLIDKEQFLAAIDPDDEECIDIYVEFCDTAAADIIRIADLIATSDWTATAALSHQLKGSSATLGFIALSKWAAKVELQAKQGSVTLPDGWRAELDGSFLAARAEADALIGRS